MKRNISLMLVFSMLISMLTFVSAFGEGGVVFSEGFENGISNWKINNEDYSDKFTFDSDASEGKKSLCLTDDIDDKLFNITSSNMPAKPLYDYQLTFDYKVLEGKGAKVYMQFANENGKTLLSQSVIASGKEWKSAKKLMASPEGTTFVRAVVWGQDSDVGKTLIDNIKISEIGKTYIETYEKKALKDGEIAASFKFNEPLDNSWKYSDENHRRYFSVAPDCYSEGSGSLHIFVDEADKAPSITSKKFGAEPNGKYTLSIDCSVAEGVKSKVYVCFYDSSDKRIYSTSTQAEGSAWTRIVSSHVAPEGTEYGRILIQPSAATRSRNFVDNVILYKGDIKDSIDKTIVNPVVTNYKTDYRVEDYKFPDKYNMPEFKPTIGHPRVYFNKDDIETIKKNASHHQNLSAYTKLMKDVESTVDGKLKDTPNNLDGKILGIIQSKAFYYAVWGDEKAGREAVSMLNNFCDTANPQNSEYNMQGLMVFTIAAVYDWCYPLLTEIDKKYFQNMGVVAASTMEITFPPAVGNVINGHSAEAQLQRDQMALAIAVYDERPDIYKNVAGRYFDEMVFSKQWLATAKASMFGDSYSTYRYQWEVIACYMMSALGVDKIYGEDHGKTLYWNLYARRGDGQLLRDGDSKGNHKGLNAYDTTGTRAYFLAGNYYKDPYLKGEFMRQNNGMVITDISSNQTLGAVEFLCFNDPSVEYKTVRELPLSMYYPTPKGDMIARTGWEEGINSPSVVAEMSVDEYFTLAHDHLDSGEFEIYYKGSLATDTGYYQAGRDGSTTENSGNTVAGSVHFYNYQRRTIAHNCMLVYDPNEDPAHFNNNVNDGGQTSGKHFADGVTHVKDYLKKEDEYHFANVMGREIGEDTIQPDYTYLKGDLQNAYGEKVPEYERSFMFLNLKNNDYPAAMIVFDRVVSKDKSFKKSWVLHGVNEPEVSGQRTVFRRGEKGYNGKLTVDTLLPKAGNTEIKVVGGEGQEWMVNGTNYWAQELGGMINEGGGYRIEVSPKAESEKDYFLNVLQVGDNDKDLAPLESEMIEGNTHYGVKVSDRVVMFGKEKDRVSSSVTFEVKGDGWFKYTVADLKEGTWQVIKDGNNLCEIVSAKDGGVGSFEAASGAFTLKYLGDYGEKQFTKTPFPETEGINLKMGTTYIYSDVEPFTENGRTLVPMRAIFEALEANVTWDEATSTATGEKDGIVIKITENSKTALVNGKEYELDAPAQIKNGRFVVPVRFISENFGVNVGWDDFSNTVILNSGLVDGNTRTYKGDFKTNHQIDNILVPKTLIQFGGDSGTDESNISNVFDSSYSSTWAFKETNDGELGYGIFDFGKEVTVDDLYIAFKSGNKRISTLSVFVSSNGKTFTPVKEKLVSTGKPDTEFDKFELGGAKGRYIKILGLGNSTNTWNNYTEIVFSGK